MTLSLMIPAELQIGVVDITKARPGAVQRRLQMAIEWHLFEGQDSLNQVVTGFAAQLNLFVVSNEGIKAYWSLLNTPPEEPKQGSEPADPPPPGSDFMVIEPESKESDEAPLEASSPHAALFCLALQGLSGAFALERLGWSDRGGASEDNTVPEITDEREDGDEEDSEWDAATAGIAETEIPGNRSKLSVSHATAVRTIADLLRRRTWNILREVTADPTARGEITSFTAGVLLEALVGVLNDWFVVEQDRKGGPRRIVMKDQRLEMKLDKFLAEMPFHFTPQPLRAPVRYEIDATPNQKDDREGFHVDLIGYRRRNKFISEFHDGAMAPGNRSPRFETYMEAVNAQMAVAWRINKPLLSVIRALTGYAGDASVSEGDLRLKKSLAELDNSSAHKLRNWVKEKLYRPSDERGRIANKLPGEFLDHLQAEQVLTELVDRVSDQRFYLCWKADFRGRIYAHTPWLTPQGSDIQRALFEFAEGRKLDENGVGALRRHGANLVSSDRILGELGLSGRRVVTLDERERWVEHNESRILASAANPVHEGFWREKGIKKPIQFLGFCFAYAQWKTDPEVLIHLPTQIDGTCNGLQHIAALTGDARLARAVNVLPREDGLPGDIYSELARDAAFVVTSKDIEKGYNLQGLRFGNRWLDRKELIADLLDRDTAKAVIMTIPYGASQNTQAAAVLKKIEAKIEAIWQQDDLQDGVKDLVDWIAKKADRVTFVKKCTEGKFESRRTAARKRDDAGGKEALARCWELQSVAAYVSLTLVERLRKALTASYPSVDKFSAWLEGKAMAAAGLPLVWMTPLGFPVCQNKFEMTKGSITAHLAGKPERLDLRRLDMRVSPKEQKNGLMPNLIHSLDATHLAMVLVAAHAAGLQGLGSIHDCLQCHPNDAAALAGIVREQFAHLYAADASGAPALRTAWEDWIDILVWMGIPGEADNVLNAWKHPNGLIARSLETTAANDTVAARALALLTKLRTLERPEAYLSRAVLEFVGSNYQKTEPEKPDSSDSAKEKNPDSGSSDGDDARFALNRHSSDIGLSQALRLEGGQAISPYFFS